MVTGGSRSGVKVEGATRGAGSVFGDELLAHLEVAVWVYDFEAGRIIWANPAALKLWDAESPEALAARDMRIEMSASVKTRLAQHYEDFLVDPGREIREFWTLYPNNKPFRARAILRRCGLPDGGIGMMVEARAEDMREPATVRSADALLHTQTIVALFDRNERELYANPAFRAAFGPGEHYFGRNFVSPADLLEFEEALAGVGEHRATLRVRTVAGERWHLIHAIRCRDAFTGEGAFLINATDVTESREQQQELKRARDVAEAAVKVKSQFLATMSHEMRTPLNGVLGMASVLAGSNLDPQQRKMLEIVQASGERMLELVENVLELVALDSQTVELASEPFELDLVLEAAIGSSAAAAKAKGIRIITSIGDLRGVGELRHDASRIGQVLRHLIDNAVKFTHRGFVSVRAEIEDGACLRFEVADSGIGIAEKARQSIFSRFFQVDSSSTREKGGSGIGLAICKELVDLWGGEIGVESEPGRGSVFWFTVPGVVAPKSERTTPAEPARPNHLRVVARRESGGGERR